MESYLVSLENQEVFIDAISFKFQFQAWEPIHTEYSYKYLESDIDALAEATGFTKEAQFFDRRRWFTNALFRVENTGSAQSVIPDPDTQPQRLII